MGVRNSTAGTTTKINTSCASGADTIVFTTGAIGLTQDNAQVMLFWQLTITMGSTATGLVIKLLRGNSASGTLLNLAPTITTVATNIVQASGCYVDFPGVLAGVQYTLTAQPSGGGTNSTAQDGSLLAMVL